MLSRLHQDIRDQSHSTDFVQEEFQQITAQVSLDIAEYGKVTLLDLFRKPHFAKRMLAAAIVMFTSQACGNLVIYSMCPL